jgi:hypothetical protein
VVLDLHEDPITFVRFAWLIMCGLLVARVAYADGTEADRLFEEGRALAKNGQFSEACERFAKSLAIERTVGTELNLADCQQQLGHLREAWGLFVSAANESESNNDAKRAAFAHDRATALEPKMATVLIKVAQPTLVGLVITIGGRATAPAPEIHERTDPGTIDVVATAPRLPNVKRTVTAVAGGEVTIDIPVMDTTVTVAPPPREDVATDGDRVPSRVHLAYGLGIGGIATGITAGALTLIGRSHYTTATGSSHCTKVPGGVTCDDIGTNDIHSAQRLADIGTGFAVAGIALIVSSAIVYATAPRERIYVRASASTKSAGLLVGGNF